MDSHSTFTFGLTCLAFGINAALNGWVIHSVRIMNFYNVFQSRAIGTLILMVPCITFFKENLFAIRSDAIISSVLISVSLSLAAWWFNKIRKRPASETRNHAYLLKGTYGVSFYLLEVASWTFYLMPYEYLMRGLLFNYLSNNYNTVFSLLLNCFLYALFHAQQGVREVLGAFLFGLLLCGSTMITGSFWSAFFIHLMFALSNSFMVVRNNGLTLNKEKS